MKKVLFVFILIGLVYAAAQMLRLDEKMKVNWNSHVQTLVHHDIGSGHVVELVSPGSSRSSTARQ